MATKEKSTRKANGDGTKRVRRNDGGVADWFSATPEAVHEAIARITLAGGAVRFGYTTDGGAYSVGIYGDGEPYTDYIRPNEDIDEYLRALSAAWADSR